MFCWHLSCFLTQLVTRTTNKMYQSTGRAMPDHLIELLHVASGDKLWSKVSYMKTEFTCLLFKSCLLCGFWICCMSLYIPENNIKEPLNLYYKKILKSNEICMWTFHCSHLKRREQKVRGHKKVVFRVKQRHIAGMWECVREQGWRQKENAFFFFPDFLENSTRIPMRPRTQASVRQLFCRKCVCVYTCMCLYCLLPRWRSTHWGYCGWFFVVARSVIKGAARNQNGCRYKGLVFSNSQAAIGLHFSSKPRHNQLFHRRLNHPSSLIRANKKPVFCHFLCNFPASLSVWSRRSVLPLSQDQGTFLWLRREEAAGRRQKNSGFLTELSTNRETTLPPDASVRKRSRASLLSRFLSRLWASTSAGGGCCSHFKSTKAAKHE